MSAVQTEMVVVYHGTSKSAARGIEANGGGHFNFPLFVTTSESYAISVASGRARSHAKKSGGEPEGVVFSMRVPAAWPKPDPDCRPESYVLHQVPGMSGEVFRVTRLTFVAQDFLGQAKFGAAFVEAMPRVLGDGPQGMFKP